MRLATLYATALLALGIPSLAAAQPSFITFESGQVRPLALSPSGSRLFAVNTPDNRLEIFDVDGSGLTHAGSVAVGLEPVAVAARSETEVWVVNHLSDSVSIVDVSSSPHVARTLLVGDEPRDIVFAGTGGDRVFITTAHRGQQRVHPSIAGVPGAGDPQLITAGVGRADVWVFDAATLGDTIGGTPIRIITLFADTPRALAVSADGNTVYAAGFHTGNQTTTVSEPTVCNGFGTSTCAGDGITSPGGLSSGRLPGGNPGPNRNVENITAPEVGLIVKFNKTNSRWEDELGRNWNNGVRFSLPDKDVFAINANTLSEVAFHASVGTTLFNMLVNPANGDLYVTNTEARNLTRFEGPGDLGGSTVQGHLAEARITVIDNPNTTNPASVKPRHLNKHINYAVLADDPGFDPDAKLHSLAIPLEMALDSTGKLYVAAFGSSKIGVFDSATLEANTFDPTDTSDDYISVSGGGPSGLVLDETNGRLYVLTRFDNSVSVVDLGTGDEEDHIALHNPEPPQVVNGRPFLYDAANTSGNGEASCASCHIFGDLDQLAWDLGNPDDVVTSNPMTIRLVIGAGSEVNGGAANNQFHPMKGPMTTQTLRGLRNSGPMHWRGDRADGAFGTGVDEALSFDNFIVAFPGLLGMEGMPSTPDMQAFTDFALEITLPPNPVRALDNSLTPDEDAGRAFYVGPRRSDGVNIQGFGFNCNGCHVLNPGVGFFGTDGNASFENETQIVKVPHLRNVYQKVGMFGAPGTPFINPGDNAHKGDQIRGYGILHDGSVDTLFRFFNATVFNNTGPVGFDGPSNGDVKRRQVEQFVLAFDTDLAPIVGQQVTLDGTDLDLAAVVNPRIDLFRARALTSFTSQILGPGASECDLIVKGTIAGTERGWVMLSNGRYKSDKSIEPTLGDVAMRDVADIAGQQLTFTCVPPGSGRRAGIDRDEDQVLDADDNCPGAANPGQEDSDLDTIGDACDPFTAPAQPQNAAQQLCINTLNKDFAKVAKAHGKDVLACIQDNAGGDLTGLVEACLTADRKGKVGKAKGRTISDETRRCLIAPDFGKTDAVTVNAAASQKELDLIHDVFGPDLDAALITETSNATAAKCQGAVASRVLKCQDTRVAEFNRCKKDGLKNQLVQNPEALAQCIGADPKGKIAKACGPQGGAIAKDIGKQCVTPGVNLAAAFPGCATGDALALATCLDQSVECRACVALNAADGLSRDCDTLDDGVANASCS